MKLLRATNVLLGENLVSSPGAVLQIENGTITKIYESIDKVEQNLRQYIEDYPGCTILPGLIDSHSHLALDTRLTDHLAKMSDPKDVQMKRARTTLKDDLRSGVTTTRTLGDKYYIDLECARLQKEIKLLGPRIVPCGIGMRSIDGHGYVGEGFGTVDEFINQSRTNITKGAKTLKLFATGVIRSTSTIPSTLSSDIISAVVDYGRSKGVPTTIHASGGVAVDYALDANIHSIEHLYYVSPSQVQRMKALGTWAVLTPSYGMDDFLLKKFSPLDWEDTLVESQTIKECLSLLIKEGLNYGIGTDGNHGSLYKEAQYISMLGESNYNILRALTIQGSRLLGLENTTGHLTEGLSADLIVTRGSPLDDLIYLKDPTAVYLKGEVI